MRVKPKNLKLITILILATILFILPIKVFAMGSFYNSEDKEGFYWYGVIEDNTDRQEDDKYIPPTPKEAHASLELRKKQLDDARDQMHAIGYDSKSSEESLLSAIKKYKELEQDMWVGAERIVAAHNMVNFMHPELLDNLNEPTNVYGAKIQRQLTSESQKEDLQAFSKDYDLVLFTSESCKYCQAFLPVFSDFVSDFNFTHEVAALDSNAGSVAQKLGVDSVPTLVAVKKDGSNAFEISRGMVSGSELKENISLGLKHSKALTTKASNNSYRR